MKFILPLLLLASTAHADIWTLYDGDGSKANTNAPTLQAGVTTQRYNAAAWLSWENEGGDWWDAAGVRQGNVPFSTAAPVAGKITLDVSGALNGEGFIIKTIPRKVLSLHSREGAIPPVLELTMADGSIVLRTPIADAGLSKSTTKPQGQYKTLNVYDAAVLSFGAIPSGAVSGKLILSVASGAGTVGVFKLHVPRKPAPEVTTGYSVNYPRDAGIETDPRTIYFESWDRPDGARPFDWWTKTGQVAGPNAQWKQDGGLFLNPNYSGMWIADGSGQVKAQCSDAMMDRGLGYIDNGLTGIHCRNVLARGTEAPTVFFRTLTGAQLPFAYLRYMIWYDEQHKTSVLCEGGKAPGLSGDTAYSGNSGNPGYGVGGHSFRNQFHPICDPGNPAYGEMSFSTYAYPGDRYGDLNGGHWGQGEFALLKLGRWACIEQYVKVNTAGEWDGVVKLWIDGREVFSKTDVFMRSIKPPQGYGDWQLVSKTYPVPEGAITWTDPQGHVFYWQGKTSDHENELHKMWGTIHWGGKTPSGADHQMRLDQTVVATERIGCPVMTSAPPDDVPPDVTPPDDPPPPPPPPAKTDLEIAREQLAAAQEALAAANAQIALSAETAGTMAERLAVLQADLLITEARESMALAKLATAEWQAGEAARKAEAAEAIINQVREVLK